MSARGSKLTKDGSTGRGWGLEFTECDSSGSGRGIKLVECGVMWMDGA